MCSISTIYPIAPSTPRTNHHLSLPLGLPTTPSNRNPRLQKRRNPQRPRKPSPALAQEPSPNRPRKQQHRSHRPSAPIRIIRHRRGKQPRIAHQVAVQARQHHGRHGIVLEHAARDNLSRALEREKGDGRKVRPGEGVADRLDDVPAYVHGFAALGLVMDGAGGGQDGDDAGDDGLDEEGDGKHPAFLGAKGAVEAGEEEGAEGEADDGEEAARPGFAGEVFGLAADAEADEDCVSW